MLEDRQLSQMFLRKGLIDDQTLNKATSIAAESGRTLYDVLLADGLVDEEGAIIAVSKQLNLPCVSLKDFNANKRILELIKRDVAERFRLIPLGLTEEDGVKKLFVAMQNPLDIDAIEEVGNISGFAVSPLLAGPNDITRAIERSYAEVAAAKADAVAGLGAGLGDGLGDMLDDLFAGDADVDMVQAESTPATPAAAAVAKLPAAKLASKKADPLSGFTLDFGDLGLSVGQKAPSVEDVHSRRTLPAGTELPPETKAFTRTPTAVKDRATLTDVTAKGSEQSLAMSDDWADLDDLGMDMDGDVSGQPEARSQPGSSRPGGGDISGVRYVADKSAGSRSTFPFNVASSDLIRATVRLLINKGIIDEKSLREELRKLRE